MHKLSQYFAILIRCTITTGCAGFRVDWESIAYTEQGRMDDNGGKWEHRDVGTELALAGPGIRYLLSLDFDVPVPAPESSDIALDLSNALKDMGNAGSEPLPLIRFAPIRWKEGYT